MTSKTLEDRVKHLERELEHVKQQVQSARTNELNDWRSTFASFANDASFEQIVHEGRLWRSAENESSMP